MIHWIRSLFCKHDFIHVQTVKYLDCYVDTYMCKHCGWVRKVIT